MAWLLVVLALAYGVPLLAFSIGHYRLFQWNDPAGPGRIRSILSFLLGFSTKVPSAGAILSQLATFKGIPSISVVVAARNEEDYIGQCLGSLLKQTIPIEIILVDDGSEDNTTVVAEEFGDRIRLIHLEFGQGKKAAIEVGVLAAQGDIILFTDADSTVLPSWAKSMRDTFTEEVAFVAGPVAFEVGDRFFDRIVALEWAGLMGISAGAIGIGIPVNCSGANIGYRKSVFQDVHGFKGLAHLSSGDDELMMQRIASKTDWKVVFSTSPEAVVTTRAPKSIREFSPQRVRWASKGAFYHRKWHIAINVGIWLYFLSIPVAGVASIWIEAIRIPFFIGIGIKVSSEVLMLAQSTSFYGRRKLMRDYILAIPFQIGYVLWAGAAGFFGNWKWKSRQLNR
jgi:cellulose synthase/poly-beta-1,6-N-acetylglucosamine synthase-like glycosyltransferase